MKKIFCAVGILMLLFSSVVTASAEAPLSVTLRIEGAEETLFYDTVEIPYQAGLTVWDVIEYVDAKEDSLNVYAPPSAYGIYINEINGENSGQVAPLYYDGWSYRLNGVDGIESVDACAVSNGDSIIVYYSDAWGNEGFQIPDKGYDKDIDKGILRFTSTTFDWNENKDVTTPIVGATVTWGYADGKTAVYTSDENGEVKIDAKHLTVGEHALQIEKYSTTITTVGGKLPLVLRLPSDTAVTVKAKENTNVSSKPHKQESDSKKDDDLESPKTGDDTVLFAMVIGIVAMGGVLLFCKKRLVW